MVCPCKEILVKLLLYLGKKNDFRDFLFCLAIAEVYKNEGNAEYQKREFSNAIHFYTEGINVNSRDDELNSKLHSNRATSYFYLGKVLCQLMYSWIKNPCISNLTDFRFLLGNYHESLNDAKAAVEMQPHYIKAIARGKVYWHSICSLYWYLHREKKISRRVILTTVLETNWRLLIISILFARTLYILISHCFAHPLRKASPS